MRKNLVDLIGHIVVVSQDLQGNGKFQRLNGWSHIKFLLLARIPCSMLNRT